MGLIRRFGSSVLQSKYRMPPYFENVNHLSLPKFLLNSIGKESPDKIVMVDGTNGKNLSNKQLYDRTYSFAHNLSVLGVKKASCVAICSPNDINYFSIFNGIGLLGAHSTTINPTYTETVIILL